MYDGLPNNNYRQNAYFKGRSGYYYFGGLYGLTAFKPQQINANRIPPIVKLSNLKINNKLELVKLTPETKVSNVPDMKALKSGMAMRVHYEMAGKNRVAKQIVVKPKIKVPPEQLIDVKELTQLVEKGPEKGAYTLVDSRPGTGYQKGFIPTAISIPFAKMDEMMDKLPKEKDI